MNISVIGLGKLGSCMAVVYASKGHTVVGVDIQKEFVDKINAGEAPVKEKDLDEYIQKGKEMFRATTEYSVAIQQSDITFIIVPTPTDETGGFTAKYVEAVCENIGRELQKKSSYHVVVLTSTLLPGDCQEKVIPILEKYSGKICGEDFGFCYSPEFIAIGSVVYDLLHPDFFLIGESDKKSGDLLESFYATVSDNNAPVRRMSISSAELTKISLNSFLTMKITFANMLTEVAEHIPGVHIDHVTEAIGSDKRVGKYYLRGGLGFGGPCFPRDNRAFAYMAERRGVKVPFAEKTDEYNRSIIERSVKKITSIASKADRIAMLSLSYKPGTYFAEESHPVLITDRLVKEGYTVHVCNPDGNDHVKAILKDTVIYHETALGCVKEATVLFLGNMGLSQYIQEMHSNTSLKIIIDPWRQLDVKNIPLGIDYLTFGQYS